MESGIFAARDFDNDDGCTDDDYDTVFTSVQKSVTATVISESWNQLHFCNKSVSISLTRVIFEK